MTNVSAPLSTQRSELLDRLAQPHLRPGRDRRRSNRPGGGAGCCGARVQRGAGGFARFRQGTSSRATKLVHGGVRYLAQGNISLVREALHERTTLLSNAPHLAQPLAFVMPSYRFGRRRFMASASRCMTPWQARPAWGPPNSWGVNAPCSACPPPGRMAQGRGEVLGRPV
jgi:glycerol-3-phosphate dehydrogenase